MREWIRRVRVKAGPLFRIAAKVAVVSAPFLARVLQ